MRRKNLLKELGIQKQADTSCNVLDIDTENVRQRVYAKLDFADTERKQTTMRSKKKILPLSIAATLTIGVTAMAATGKISMWTGSSASRADYTSLPTSEQITKDIGYRPVLIDTFKNGYCFKEGNIIKNSFKDGNANVIENFKSVSFDYQKNGDVVSFEQQKFNSKLTPSGDIIATVNGTNLYYVHYINKVVSDDYELTEQDKKDQSSAKAREYQVPFTIHAGEAGNAEDVKTAVHMGAVRIGHGVRIAGNKEVIQLVKDKGIFLEMCPTSNRQTKAVEEMSAYPLKAFLEMGLKVTLNTDDPAIERTTLSREFRYMESLLDLTQEQKRLLLLNSVEAAFTSRNRKWKLKEQLLF